MNELAPRAIPLVLAAELATACSGSSNHAQPTPSQSAGAENAGDHNQATDKYCNDQTYYEAGQYKMNIGANLTAPLGTVTANGQYSFGNKKPTDIDVQMANSMTPNLAGQSVIFTILKAESGVTPAEIANKSKDEFDKMVANPAERKTVCATVIGRILSSPDLRQFQPQSGAVVIAPGYDAKQSLDAITGTHEPVTKPVEVFGLAPIKDENGNIAPVDDTVYRSWGIEASGEVLIASAQQESFRVALSGAPVKPTPNSPLEAKAGGSGQNNGGSSSGTNGNTGKTGTTIGQTPEKNPGPASGPNSGPGVTPEASAGPTHNTPGGGPTAGPSSGPNASPTPEQSTPPATQPPETQPPSPSATPTTTKGTEPPCVPNPPYVICPTNQSAADMTPTSF